MIVTILVLIWYFSALSQFNASIFIFFFFINILANISFPGTGNFIGELLISISLIKSFHFFFVFLVLFSLIFNVVFSFFLLVRILFGPFY